MEFVEETSQVEDKFGAPLYPETHFINSDGSPFASKEPNANHAEKQRSTTATSLHQHLANNGASNYGSVLKSSGGDLSASDSSSTLQLQTSHGDLFFDDPPMRSSSGIVSSLSSSQSRSNNTNDGPTQHTVVYGTQSQSDQYRLVLQFEVSKSFSCVYKKERRYLVHFFLQKRDPLRSSAEVNASGVEATSEETTLIPSKIILKTYQQCLHLHKLLVALFGDLIPQFPYTVWLLHSEQEIANMLTKYFQPLTKDQRIVSSFAMRLFLEEFDLTGKVALITGASSGIGLATAISLAQMNCHVVLACRSREKTQKVIEDIKRETGNLNVEYLRLNLASLTSVQACITAFQEKNLPLNYLVLNAGIASTMPVLTEDGFESIMGVNHIGHFVLTTGLLHLLLKGAPSRIVCVSSDSHRLAETVPTTYNDMIKPIATLDIFDAYNKSKLANCLFVKELSKRLPPQVTANIANPGTVGTDIWRDLPELLQWGIKGILSDPLEGAFPILQCLIDPILEETSNFYFDPSGRSVARSMQANDEGLSQKLWKATEECVRVALKQPK